MLSCNCSYDDYEWWYEFNPTDFEDFVRVRRKRCVSCKELIGIRSKCLRFECHRHPKSDIEERITGEWVPIADKFLCDKCGEIYLNLTSIGYCLNLGHNIKEDLEEYWDLTGFEPIEEQCRK